MVGRSVGWPLTISTFQISQRVSPPTTLQPSWRLGRHSGWMPHHIASVWSNSAVSVISISRPTRVSKRPFSAPAARGSRLPKGQLVCDGTLFFLGGAGRVLYPGVQRPAHSSDRASAAMRLRRASACLGLISRARR